MMHTKDNVGKMEGLPNYSPLTKVAIEAVLKGGIILQQGFGTQFKISLKPGVQNYVTEYDHASENCIINTIRETYPHHGFLAEESGSSPGLWSEVLWILDPLDGTTNFAHNIPIFCISLGAVSNGELICGVIYQPITKELFVAEKGLGSFLNHVPIRVSKTVHFGQGMGATGFPRNIYQNPLNCIDCFISVLKNGTLMRNLGSSALNLAYVAAGRFDVYWAISLHSWDVAAGILLVLEGGGAVTAYDGSEYDVLSGMPIVASNQLIHQEVIQYVNCSEKR